jgi:hypothetical protein
MKMFITKINGILRLERKTEVKFVKSSEVCPYMEGLQSLEGRSELQTIIGVEPNGYCGVWSMFFTELCLRNPEIPSSTLMTYIYDTFQSMGTMEKKNYLRSVIRGYTGFINEKIEKYFSLFFPGLTLPKIDKFTGSTKKRFQRIIRNIINIEMNLSTNPLFIQSSLEEMTEESKKLQKQFQEEKNLVNISNLVKKLDDLRDLRDVFAKHKLLKVSDASSPVKTILSKEIISKEPAIKNEVSRVKEPTIKKELSIKKKKICPEGKEINPKTGRCIKIKTQKRTTNKKKTEPQVKSKRICPEGKEINPSSGRCIKIKTQKQRVTKTCPEGKVINEKTGRCNKMKTQKRKVQPPSVML